MTIWRVQRARALGANHASVSLLQLGGPKRGVGALLPIKIFIFYLCTQIISMRWHHSDLNESGHWVITGFGNFTDFLSKGQVWFIQDWTLEKSSPIIKMSKWSIHRHVGNIQTTDTSSSTLDSKSQDWGFLSLTICSSCWNFQIMGCYF